MNNNNNKIQINKKNIPWVYDVEGVIDILKHIDVDGHTMEYIIQETGMRDQMLRQLVLKSNPDMLIELMSELKECVTNNR